MRSEYKSYSCLLIACRFTTFSSGLSHDNLFVFPATLYFRFCKQLWNNSCVEDSEITFYGDRLIQNVILILEVGQGSLKPSNDGLLKDDLVASEPASCPTQKQSSQRDASFDSIYMSIFDGTQRFLARRDVCLPPLQLSLAFYTTISSQVTFSHFTGSQRPSETRSNNVVLSL